MSLATGSSVFRKLFSMFRAGDPLKREIAYSINTVEKMIRSLEVTKKNLEAIAEEHKKRGKISEGDRELSKIIEEEVKNIQGYLNLMTKSIYDLTRVKFRLETIFYVEEPLKVLPEVLEELRSIEPVIEKINPQLLSQIKTLEQRVAGLLAMSSMSTPSPHIPVAEQKAEQRAPQKPESLQGQVKSLVVEKHVGAQTRTEEPARANIVQPESLTLPSSTTEPRTIVPLNVIEQWILLELKQTAGILDLTSFERKYGVPRALILEALRSLESKNLIKVRRK